MKLKNWLVKAITLIGSLQVTVINLIILAILVVWGTLYQIDNGIYAAQERFFNAWFTLIGGYIPFPAVKTVIAVLSVNLLSAAFRKRPVNLTTAGIIIMHLGVAALIGGSAVSSNLVQESAITLSEGQQTSETYDFATWRLTLSVNGSDNGKPFSKIIRHDLRRLTQGQQIKLPSTSTTVTIHHIYRNCAATVSSSDNRTITGLSPRAADPERGRNVPGIVFSVSGSDGFSVDKTGQHFAYAGSMWPSPFAYGDDTVAVSLQPLALPLPLKIELRRFSVEWHPGTSKAKRFQTRLRIFGKNIDRDVVIEMNRPFRYRAFTFYQMGYNDRNGRYESTLAIVRNPLRYLPYVSSLIIVVGLFLHFFVKMIRQLSSNRSNHRE